MCSLPIGYHSQSSPHSQIKQKPYWQYLQTTIYVHTHSKHFKWCLFPEVLPMTLFQVFRKTNSFKWPGSVFLFSSRKRNFICLALKLRRSNAAKKWSNLSKKLWTLKNSRPGKHGLGFLQVIWQHVQWSLTTLAKMSVAGLKKQFYKASQVRKISSQRYTVDSSIGNEYVNLSFNFRRITHLILFLHKVSESAS